MQAVTKESYTFVRGDIFKKKSTATNTVAFKDDVLTSSWSPALFSCSCFFSPLRKTPGFGSQRWPECGRQLWLPEYSQPTLHCACDRLHGTERLVLQAPGMCDVILAWARNKEVGAGTCQKRYLLPVKKKKCVRDRDGEEDKRQFSLLSEGQL